MDKLEEARNIISQTDGKIAALFEERMRAVEEVARYKKERGLPIVDAERERALLEKNLALIGDGEYRPYFVGVFKALTDVSKSYQRKLLEGMRVAYAGVPGAFAHTAARSPTPKPSHTPISPPRTKRSRTANATRRCSRSRTATTATSGASWISPSSAR